MHTKSIKTCNLWNFTLYSDIIRIHISYIFNVWIFWKLRDLIQTLDGLWNLNIWMIKKLKLSFLGWEEISKKKKWFLTLYYNYTIINLNTLFFNQYVTYIEVENIIFNFIFTRLETSSYIFTNWGEIEFPVIMAFVTRLPGQLANKRKDLNPDSAIPSPNSFSAYDFQK